MTRLGAGCDVIHGRRDNLLGKQVKGRVIAVSCQQHLEDRGRERRKERGEEKGERRGGEGRGERREERRRGERRRAGRKLKEVNQNGPHY